MRKRGFVLPSTLTVLLIGLCFVTASLALQNFARAAEAGEKSSAGKKSPAKSKKLNSNLYEQDSGTSVSGKVKAVREIQEETEVFLESSTGSGGPFVLPQNAKNRAGILKILTRSQKPGGPSVKLELDDQQRIKSAEEGESSSSEGPAGNWEL